jgi:hypothetical protein
MAQNRSKSMLDNLDYAVAVRRSEREIIDAIKDIPSGEEVNITVKSENTGEEFLLRVSRV